jgi:hypothetical protein
MYTPLFIAAISFTYLFGGALLGYFVQYKLPHHHLQKGTGAKSTVKLAASLISTMAALVIGMLIASSKNSFDAVNMKVSDAGAKAILLDRNLAHFGNAASPVRSEFKTVVHGMIDRIQHESDSLNGKDWIGNGLGLESVEAKILLLRPENESQQEIRAASLGYCRDLELTRWELLESSHSPLPAPLLGITFFWLTALLTFFTLFAPRNLTVLIIIFITALSISAAIYLLQELSAPSTGLIHFSVTPLQNAFQQLGK